MCMTLMTSLIIPYHLLTNSSNQTPILYQVAKLRNLNLKLWTDRPTDRVIYGIRWLWIKSTSLKLYPRPTLFSVIKILFPNRFVTAISGITESAHKSNPHTIWAQKLIHLTEYIFQELHLAFHFTVIQSLSKLELSEY